MQEKSLNVRTRTIPLYVLGASVKRGENNIYSFLSYTMTLEKIRRMQYETIPLNIELLMIKKISTSVRWSHTFLLELFKNILIYLN